MICQTNDTEFHKPMRKDLCELQEELVLNKVLTSGGGLKECTNEENVLILATVFSNKELHLQGCKGYKYTGTTVAFDGSEDELIGKDARQFWDEMDMRARIDKELKILRRRHQDKELMWNFENIQKAVIPYPKHGKYDAEPEGMEDETVPSVVAENETPWVEDDVAESDADEAASEVGSAGDEERRRCG